MRWNQSAVLEQACRSAPLASPLTHFLSGRLCSCSCTSPSPVHDKETIATSSFECFDSTSIRDIFKHLDKVVLARNFN